MKRWENPTDSCRLEVDALDGEGEWKKFFDDHVHIRGVYRLTCQRPYTHDGNQHHTLYVGKSKDGDNAGIGWRSTCSIERKYSKKSDLWRQEQVERLIRTESHGEIRIECLHVSEPAAVEKEMLRDYGDSEDARPPFNRS